MYEAEIEYLTYGCWEDGTPGFQEEMWCRKMFGDPTIFTWNNFGDRFKFNFKHKKDHALFCLTWL